VYVRSDQQESNNLTDFYEFLDESFIVGSRSGTSNGKYSITGNNIEFVHSDGKIEAYKLSRTPNAIM